MNHSLDAFSHPMRNSFLLALGLGLLVSGSPMLTADAGQQYYRGSASYTRELRAADTLMQTGKYQAAEAKYTALLQKNPNNTAARSGLAVAQAELYKLGAAEKNAQAVLAKDPKNVFAHIALGVTYRNRTASQDMEYRLQKEALLNQSARELERAVQLDGGLPEAHNQLGVTYRLQGRYDDAERAFDKAADLDPSFGEAMVNKSIMMMERGDMAGAKSVLQSAIKLNSKNHMAHYRLGESKLRLGDAHGALESLNTALALDKDNAAIMGMMAEAYDKQGNHAGAVAAYQSTIQKNPSYMPAYVGLSNLYDMRGDGELAMAQLKSALNVNPNYAPARNQLGRLALTVDKPDQAVRYYRESLRANPQDVEALSGLSQAMTVIAQRSANWSQTLGAESDLVEAEKAVEEALSLNPDDLRLHLAHLRLSRLAGKQTGTRQELEQLVHRQPRNASESMLQGEALLVLGRYGEADSVFQRLIRESNRDADRLLVLGDVLKVNGDLDNAETAYRTALMAEPGNLKAERALNRIEVAEAEAQKTLRLAGALNNFWQRESSIDFYVESLAKNPKQPEARLELAKLYEKYDDFSQAAQSYRMYLNLMPQLEPKKKEKYERKIAKLEERARNVQPKPYAVPASTMPTQPVSQAQ